MVLITAQVFATSNELDIHPPFKFCQMPGFQPAMTVQFSPSHHQAEKRGCNAIFGSFGKCLQSNKNPSFLTLKELLQRKPATTAQYLRQTMHRNCDQQSEWYKSQLFFNFLFLPIRLIRNRRMQ